MEHTFAQALTAVEAREFRNTVVGIRHGIDVVLEQRRRLSATLRAHITRHDAIRDRELDDALRRVKSELAAWMQMTGARSRLDMVLGLPSLEVAHLRQRFYNPDDYAPPPPLRGHGDDAVPPLSVEQLRQQGGPSLAEFRAALYERLRTGAASVTAGEVFRGMTDDLRRPVEVLGLIQIAAAVHAFDPALDDGTETFEAVRPDGSRRTFDAPRLRFGQQQFSALGDDEQGGADD